MLAPLRNWQPLLLLFVFALLTFGCRGDRRAFITSQRVQRPSRLQLTGRWRGLAVLACLLPLLLGFLIPAAQLSVWALHSAPRM